MGPPKKGTEASRAERKAKKRKLEDAIPDLPGDEEGAANGVEDGNAGVEVKGRKAKKVKTSEEKSAKKEKKEKKEKKSKGATEEAVADVVVEVEGEDEKASKKEKKKNKKEKKEEEGTADTVMADLLQEVGGEGGEDAPRKSKKERKAERKAQKAATEKPANAPEAEVDSKNTAAATDEMEKEKEKKKNNNRNRDKKRKEKAAAKDGTEKEPRFICFIGNLPYSATTDSVTKHFASVHPKSVRHRTQKENPSKSTGTAFVEFSGYDHMKTCLKLFHHSMFDDGISPARKINVELSAGGGGNSKDRKAKIHDKNAKLNEERLRRIQEEEKAKLNGKKKDAADESGIHPSRRAFVPGAGRS